MSQRCFLFDFTEGFSGNPGGYLLHIQALIFSRVFGGRFRVIIGRSLLLLFEVLIRRFPNFDSSVLRPVLVFRASLHPLHGCDPVYFIYETFVISLNTSKRLFLTTFNENNFFNPVGPLYHERVKRLY